MNQQLFVSYTSFVALFTLLHQHHVRREGLSRRPIRWYVPSSRATNTTRSIGSLPAIESPVVTPADAIDLDLEDIDATQLEDELTEPPPEPEPVAPAPAPAQQTQQYSQPSAPGPAGQNGNNGMGGYGQNQNQNQIQGGGPVSNGFSFQPQPGGFDGGNRPSDAPDEGLVDHFLYS